MDSTLIIEYAEALAAGRRCLVPGTLDERQHNTLREIAVGGCPVEQVGCSPKLQPQYRWGYSRYQFNYSRGIHGCDGRRRRVISSASP